MTKPEVGHFRAHDVPLKRKLREFPVTEDALIPVGTSLNVRHFVPGQYVDIAGITKGKGFQVLFSFLHTKFCSYISRCLSHLLYFSEYVCIFMNTVVSAYIYTLLPYEGS